MRVVPLVAGAAVLGSLVALPVLAGSQKGPLLVTVTTSPNPYAIEGSTSVIGSNGVEGYASASSTASPSYGVYGYSAAASGIYGTGPANGITGVITGTGSTQSNTPTASAIFGFDATASSTQAAVYGFSQNGEGVWGFSNKGPGTVGESYGPYAVAGLGYGSTTAGVYGFGATGVSGIGYANGGSGAVGVLASTAMQNSVGLEVQTTGAGDMPMEATSAGKQILSLDASGDLTIAGTLTQNGSAATVAHGARGDGRVMYAPQQTEATVEDFGEARTIAGRAHVALDPAFADLIDPSTPYLVFVTPEGPTAGYYVTGRTPSGFSVVDQSGRGSLAFAYRIVARPFATRGAERLAAYRQPVATRAGQAAAQRTNAMPRHEIAWPPLPKPRQAGERAARP